MEITVFFTAYERKQALECPLLYKVKIEIFK